MYGVFKWKLAFERFKDTWLPFYFNDYLNCYLKFLGVSSTVAGQSLMSPTNDKVIAEQNRALA